MPLSIERDPYVGISDAPPAGVSQAVDGNRAAVSVLSSICLASVPWMQVSHSKLEG